MSSAITRFSCGDHVHVVGAELGIEGEYLKMLSLRLCYQQPVEWVFAQQRQTPGSFAVAQSDRQRRESGFQDRPFQRIRRM